MDKFNVACIQITSGPCESINLNIAIDLINEAIDKKSQFIITPEYTNVYTQNKEELKSVTSYEDQSKTLELLSSLANKKSIWLYIGSMLVRTSKNRYANRSYVINNNGDIVAKYDKIHLFDKKLSNGEVYCESDLFLSGHHAIIVRTPWGNLGMSTCYDVRFPHLYRQLRQNGADFFVIASAFTALTGKKHWHPLVLTRAIENDCFVFAPNQCGKHSKSKESYGHSLIVSPDGEILAEAENYPTCITSTININLLDKIRQYGTSSTYKRKFTLHKFNN